MDPRETAKFAADAALWWDETRGPFAPLHAMNPTRCAFVRDVLTRHFRGSEKHADVGADPARPLAGLRLLDVGCGGGILSESLARMGADVTGVDAAAANVAIAKTHVSVDPALVGKITYRVAAAETLLAERASFDAVLALEVIEHARDPDAVRCLAGLTHERGAVIVSTLNRTARSAALAIAFAERVAGWVPPGTQRVLQVPRAGRTGDARRARRPRDTRGSGDGVHAPTSWRGCRRDRGDVVPHRR